MERVFTAITSQPEMERKWCLNLNNKKHTKIQAQTAGAGLTDSPDDVYRTCLTAVLSLISKPSASATGTHEYPFRTVRWLPVNSKSSSYSNTEEKGTGCRSFVFCISDFLHLYAFDWESNPWPCQCKNHFLPVELHNTTKSLKVFCKKRWVCSTWSQCLSESVDRGVALANSRFAKCQSRICLSLEDR